MEDIVKGALNFSKFLRFQLFKKQNQVLKRDIYSKRIWGSHIKGGLEVCDAILLEHQDCSFVDVEDLETRINNLMLQLKEELNNVNLTAKFNKYIDLKISQNFGKLNKEKLNANEFEEDIRIAVLRGSLKTCEKLIKSMQPEDSVDTALGEVHVLRMNLWNLYATSSSNMKRVDVLDTMLPNPNPRKLVYK